MRAGIDQREMQAALSALPLFHELLGFRFRDLTNCPRITQVFAGNVQGFFCDIGAICGEDFWKISSCSFASIRG